MKKEKTRGRRMLGSIGSAVLLLVLVVLSITLIVNRDSLSIDNLRRAVGYMGLGGEDQAEEFLFSDHTSNTFAVLGDGIAVASAGGLSYYGKSGELVYSELFSMDRPLIAEANGRVLAYDSGGTALKVGDEKGVLLDLEQSSELIDAQMNDNGWLAVSTDEVGTRGRVTVYNADGTEVYRVSITSGYVVRAALASDNRTLAILTLTDTGGSVLWYATDSSDQQGSYPVDDEILYDLWFTSGKTVAVVSSDRFIYLTSEGEIQSEYAFGGKYLLHYSRSGSSAALYVSPYQNSTGGSLLLFSGGEPDEIEIGGQVLDMSLRGRYLAVLFPDSLHIYRGGDLYAELDETEGMTRVLMRDDGTVFRLSAYRAKLIVP